MTDEEFEAAVFAAVPIKGEQAMQTAAPEALRAEAPTFKPGPTGIGEKYRTRFYDAGRRRSLVVRSGTKSVELNHHMHEASYVSLDFTAHEARAIAAELVAAADALEQATAAWCE